MVALDNLKAKAAAIGQNMQLGLMTGQIGKGAGAIATLGGAIRSIPGIARGGMTGLQTFAQGLNQVSNGMNNFLGAMKNGVKGLIGWNSVFGRVTMGMLTWHAWRTVAAGFREISDAIVGANMRMQTAQQMFTALSGGSEEIGSKYISIIRQLAIETGSSIDDLVSNAKRLPTQVGQNFEAFGELTRKAIVLGMLDPVQGVEGAMFSLSNFLEGTAAGARSLVQRFELFNLEMVKQAFEEAADPVEALDRSTNCKTQCRLL
jgi:methyl-accepting chemotaxis protein